MRNATLLTTTLATVLILGSTSPAQTIRPLPTITFDDGFPKGGVVKIDALGSYTLPDGWVADRIVFTYANDATGESQGIVIDNPMGLRWSAAAGKVPVGTYTCFATLTARNTRNNNASKDFVTKFKPATVTGM